MGMRMRMRILLSTFIYVWLFKSFKNNISIKLAHQNSSNIVYASCDIQQITYNFESSLFKSTWLFRNSYPLLSPSLFFFIPNFFYVCLIVSLEVCWTFQGLAISAHWTSNKAVHTVTLGPGTKFLKSSLLTSPTHSRLIFSKKSHNSSNKS